MCNAHLAAIAFHLWLAFIFKKKNPKPKKIDNLRGRTVIEQKKKLLIVRFTPQQIRVSFYQPHLPSKSAFNLSQQEY